MNKITLHYENCPRTKDGMEIRASFPCKKCKGKGVVYLSEECPSCRGSGFIYLVDCIDCLGTGVSAKKGTCSTCKGKKVVPYVKAYDINFYKKCCADLKENPIKTLALPIASIIAIAIFFKPMWKQVYVTFSPSADIFGMVSMVIFSLAWLVLIFACVWFFKGSRYDSEKGYIRSVGLLLIGAGLLVSVITGPLTSDKYEWLEETATKKFNKRYTIIDVEQLTCTRIKINKREKLTYFGDAKLSNGKSMPVVVTVKHRQNMPYIEVEIVK